MRRPYRLIVACILTGSMLASLAPAAAAEAPLRSDVRLASGLRLSYLEWGTAARPTLLLLHGKGSTAADLAGFAAALAADYHVYAVDARGCGFSDWAADGNYAVEAVVDDLAQLARAMGWNKVTVYGHSLGAVEGIALAGRYPHYVGRLILEDGGPVTLPDGALPPLNPGQAAPAGASTPPPPNPVFSSWNEVVADERARARQLAPLALESRYVRSADGKIRRRADVAGWAATARGKDFTHPWALVKAIAAPTLLLRAERGLVPEPIARAMVYSNPGIRYVDIPGAGHNIHGPHQQAVLDQVSAFSANAGRSADGR